MKKEILRKKGEKKKDIRILPGEQELGKREEGERRRRRKRERGRGREEEGKGEGRVSEC